MTSHQHSTSVSAASYEATHVHDVYAEIATHFSATRHHSWPLVEAFLRARRPGSVGLDVGCGNGKYLACGHPGIVIVGSDRSSELVAIAGQQGRGHSQGRGKDKKSALSSEASAASAACPVSDVLVADTLSLPHPLGRFDFAICIAVVHHLSTRDRRRGAVRAVLGCLRGGRDVGGTSVSSSSSLGSQAAGQAMIYVWALEQKSSRRGWDEGGEQDVMVPWVRKQVPPVGRRNEKKKNERKPRKSKQKEAQDEKDETQQQQPTKQLATNDDDDDDDGAQEGPSEDDGGDRVFQRYYHLYRRGELEEDIIAAGGRVVESGYERDNWWAVCERRTGEGG